MAATLTACGAPTAAARSMMPPRLWILAASHFAAVVHDPAVRRLFAAATVFEPLGPRQPPSTLLPVVPTVVFHSAAAFVAAVRAGALPSGTQAVLYDNEGFPTTPPTASSLPWPTPTACGRFATSSSEPSAGR
jgi:hypothetical protein